MRKVLIITGATASGKTQLALKKAKEINGVIINCDSLQIYKDLKILTAFPEAEELAQAPHKLFGYLNYNEKISVVDWARAAVVEIENAFSNEQCPIITGGTGFYIDVLINGISPMPEVSVENREKAIELAYHDFDQLRNELYQLDPELKTLLPCEKHHQLIRAYEIYLETGKSIREYLNVKRQQFIKDVHFEIIDISIERKTLYERIENRFTKMLQKGAVEEVCSLLNIIDIPDRSVLFNQYPIFKALGAKEITLYLDGLLTFDEMKNKTILNSRHYAKRQITWFKRYSRIQSVSMSSYNYKKYEKLTIS